MTKKTIKMSQNRRQSISVDKSSYKREYKREYERYSIVNPHRNDENSKDSLPK